MTDPNQGAIPKDSIKFTQKDGNVYITEITTSHSETRQKAQYEPNSYFTSMKLNFPAGINIVDVKDLTTMVTSVSAANAMCADSNRKAQIRDGINPTIGVSATAAMNAGGANNLLKPEAIINPTKLGSHIGEILKSLTNMLNLAGVTSTLGATPTPPPAKSPAATAAPDPSAGEPRPRKTRTGKTTTTENTAPPATQTETPSASYDDNVVS